MSLSDSRASLASNFVKCVTGYHLVNNDPIKETPWESINATVLEASGCTVHGQANGSHTSGSDISCSLGNFSNKSTQYDDPTHSSFKVSSYRLTTVCSASAPGTVEAILAEMDRRKNFQYYSILVRSSEGDSIQYDWYLIPSSHPVFDPASYTWHPKLGKTSKTKDAVMGWETDVREGSRMSITFSMSSQLWMDIRVTDELRDYKIGSCTVKQGRQFNYIELYERTLAAGAAATPPVLEPAPPRKTFTIKPKRKVSEESPDAATVAT